MSEPLANEELLEELTAYLDGELDAAARERVEQRLAADPEYRRELQRLERSWDLLDRLQRASVDEAFTKTTMEMVAVAAEEDLQTAQVQRPRAFRTRWLLALSGVVAAGLVGVAFGRWMWPSPNQALLQDLPVLQHFDAYRHADSIEFLRLLDQEKLFQPEDEHAG